MYQRFWRNSVDTIVPGDVKHETLVYGWPGVLLRSQLELLPTSNKSEVMCLSEKLSLAV